MLSWVAEMEEQFQKEEEQKGEKFKNPDDSVPELIICEDGILDGTLPPELPAVTSTPQRQNSPPEHPFPSGDIRKTLNKNPIVIFPNRFLLNSRMVKYGQIVRKMKKAEIRIQMT